ncbi:MAG TPA: response regulator [Verrucomicrobiae bacterium]|nr:response regulator [Verrucomicrobiae bacterium]
MEPHFPILLAEADNKDIAFAKRAFREAALQNPLRVVKDGEQAMAYLRGAGRYSDRERYPLPKLVLMGFNIPRRNGLEVLEWVRTHPKFKELPVVMLSPSTLCPERDLRKARELGITAHLTRLPDFKELQHVYKIAVDQWNLLDSCADRDAAKMGMRTWPRSQKICGRPRAVRRLTSLMQSTV